MDREQRVVVLMVLMVLPKQHTTCHFWCFDWFKMNVEHLNVSLSQPSFV